MSYLHRFRSDDIFVNEIETHPHFSVTMSNGSMYLNNRTNDGENIVDGTVNLYELNVNRGAGVEKIFPFVYKDATLTGMNTTSPEDFEAASYGDVITGSYPLSASVSRESFVTTVAGLETAQRRHLISLKNTLNYYKFMSPSYEYDNYAAEAVSLVSIPSIMFGSGIKRGSLALRMYHTGTLVAEATDYRRNGELVSTMGDTSGSIIGVALYNEGFLVLNSTDTLTATTDAFAGGGQDFYRWIHYGAYNVGGPGAMASASVFTLDFEGTHRIPTLTMFAKAREGELNNSQNPTFLTHGQSPYASAPSGSTGFSESDKLAIKNTIKSPFDGHEADFKKQTFISEVGIYDDERNLIAVAKVANPVRKVEDNSFTFKIRMDL